jgi:hypothetical protein
MREHEETIAQLNRQRTELDTGPSAGLTDAEANAIREFAETTQLGIAEATAAERRELFDTVRLRACVVAHPDGAQLGRHHRFRIEWEATIPLSRTGTGFENCVSR